MSSRPDFTGKWVVPSKVGNFPFYESDFDLFIEQSEDFQGVLLVSGKITDNYGNASFSGSISSGEITFTKRYGDAEREVTRTLGCEIYYCGKFVEGRFVGIYRVIRGEDRTVDDGTFELRSVD